MEELYCHHCGNYIRFETKPEKTGNFVIVCPNCFHQHCRKVVNGRVTSDRWDKRSSPDMQQQGVGVTSSKMSLWEEKNR